MNAVVIDSTATTCRCCGEEVCRSAVLDVWFHRAHPAAGHVPDPVPSPRAAADGDERPEVPSA